MIFLNELDAFSRMKYMLAAAARKPRRSGVRVRKSVTGGQKGGREWASQTNTGA